MNKKRKGFTLAETIITVIIFGILAAITVPILNKAKADKDTMLYRKGMYTLQRGLQKFMESPDYTILLEEVKNTDPNFDESLMLGNFTGFQLCEALVKHINTKGRINCSTQGSFEYPNFTTVDGIKFWGFTQAKFPKHNSLAASGRILRLESVEGPSPGEIKKRVEIGKSKAYQNQKGLVVMIDSIGRVFPRRTSCTYELTLIKDYTKMKS